MKVILVALSLSLSCFADGLSPEEQQKLMNENAALKAQVEQLQKGSMDPEQSKAVMEKLQKGQKWMADQQKALDELEASE